MTRKKDGRSYITVHDDAMDHPKIEAMSDTAIVHWSITPHAAQIGSTFGTLNVRLCHSLQVRHLSIPDGVSSSDEVGQFVLQIGETAQSLVQVTVWPAEAASVM